eukprot:gb/GEZN01003247.1/.p1 GENE.gb/GEZN01003247.1/~~gb/GEZN01003247.1/.p1  ORF type:complete len:700 (-),score=83.08 gb/GEZN01003247.1/:43-2142(-)
MGAEISHEEVRAFYYFDGTLGKGGNATVEIMGQIDHPHCVKMVSFSQTKKSLLITMERLHGDLHNALNKRKNACLSEHEAGLITYRLADALNYLHNKGIVHRDLKPENVLLVSQQDITDVKLTDFGSSRWLTDSSSKMDSACGSPSYVSPEILNQKPYGPEVDVWSLGVILYRLLSDTLPFTGQGSNAQLFTAIRSGKFSFPDPVWSNINQKVREGGADPRDLIQQCLEVEPEKRISARGILAHPWVCLHYEPLCRAPSPAASQSDCGGSGSARSSTLFASSTSGFALSASRTSSAPPSYHTSPYSSPVISSIRASASPQLLPSQLTLSPLSPLTLSRGNSTSNSSFRTSLSVIETEESSTIMPSPASSPMSEFTPSFSFPRTNSSSSTSSLPSASSRANYMLSKSTSSLPTVNCDSMDASLPRDPSANLVPPFSLTCSSLTPTNPKQSLQTRRSLSSHGSVKSTNSSARSFFRSSTPSLKTMFQLATTSPQPSTASAASSATSSPVIWRKPRPLQASVSATPPQVALRTQSCAFSTRTLESQHKSEIRNASCHDLFNMANNSTSPSPAHATPFSVPSSPAIIPVKTNNPPQGGETFALNSVGHTHSERFYAVRTRQSSNHPQPRLFSPPPTAEFPDQFRTRTRSQSLNLPMREARLPLRPSKADTGGHLEAAHNVRRTRAVFPRAEKEDYSGKDLFWV